MGQRHKLLPSITNISILSISRLLAFFLINSKTVLYIPPQKSNLDKNDLGNYRRIYQISFLSKLTERVVVISRLVDYLSTNSLLNSFQSA